MELENMTIDELKEHEKLVKAEMEKKKKEITQKTIDGVDVEALSKLSTVDLKVRYDILHKAIQRAIAEKHPGEEGLIIQQRVINAVLINRLKKKGNPKDLKVRLGKLKINFNLKKGVSDMAEGDGAFYNEFFYELGNGNINLASGGDTINMILVSGYTPNVDDHCVYADVSGEEMSGTGYVAGGEALTGQTNTKNNTTDVSTFDADNVTWSGLDAGTPSHAIARDVTFDCLMTYWEVTTASNGSDYILEFAADGIFDLGA